MHYVGRALLTGRRRLTKSSQICSNRSLQFVKFQRHFGCFVAADSTVRHGPPASCMHPVASQENMHRVTHKVSMLARHKLHLHVRSDAGQTTQTTTENVAAQLAAGSWQDHVT